MDIFDIFWTFYLNHLSPLWGYFLPPDSFMTLSNRSQNKEKSAKFDCDVNFIIEPSTIEKFVMHP